MPVKRRGRRGRSGAGRRPRRTPYHHGNLRRALLDAALALIEREGADAPTLRGVAKLAGVSQAAPYRHFRNKDALLAWISTDRSEANTA